MFIKQITVFVENKVGRLSAILDTLGKNNIDISALSLADTTDFGLLRLIVDKPEDALRALTEHGVAAKITDVLAIAVNDTPGGLAGALNILTAENIAVEYMYAFVGRYDDALVVLRTADQEHTAEICKKHGIKMVDGNAYKY